MNLKALRFALLSVLIPLAIFTLMCAGFAYIPIATIVIFMASIFGFCIYLVYEGEKDRIEKKKKKTLKG